jgi:hypothetical protein
MARHNHWIENSKISIFHLDIISTSESYLAQIRHQTCKICDHIVTFNACKVCKRMSATFPLPPHKMSPSPPTFPRLLAMVTIEIYTTG